MAGYKQTWKKLNTKLNRVPSHKRPTQKTHNPNYRHQPLPQIETHTNNASRLTVVTLCFKKLCRHPYDLHYETHRSFLNRISEAEINKHYSHFQEIPIFIKPPSGREYIFMMAPISLCTTYAANG